MVSIFITAFALVLAILLVSGIGLYFWQKSARDKAERILPPNPDFYGLFGPTKTEMKTQEEIERAARLAAALLDRARAGDKSALIEAKASGDPNLYERILSQFVEQVDSDAALVSLMSFVVKNELRISPALAKTAVAAWRKTPTREGTAKALHFAALSDDADLYGDAVEMALELWRAGKLANVSAEELRALFDGEFWILSARTRSSGAGFVLKRTLESARRELTAAQQAAAQQGPITPQQALPEGRASDT